MDYSRRDFLKIAAALPVMGATWFFSVRRAPERRQKKRTPRRGQTRST